MDHGQFEIKHAEDTDQGYDKQNNSSGNNQIKVIRIFIFHIVLYWKVCSPGKKKEVKNKFVKSEYKSKLKQIEVVNELTEEIELVDAPDDMQVSKISGWNNRQINTDEL